jgi:hypothetical protein
MLAPLLLFAQLAAAVPPRPTAPVLTFPQPGLDDASAYQGYSTRFYRDAAGNTAQLYLDRDARVVTLLADAEDESVGFTARDAAGRAAPLRWAAESALVSRNGRRRTIEYRLAVSAPRVDLGWFVLGSMRVERDFQYAEKQRAPFRDAPFRVAETERLVAAIARLDPAEQGRALRTVGAREVAALRDRLQPRITLRRGGALVVQPSLDGRDTLALEIVADPKAVAASRAGNAISLRAATGDSVAFAVRVTTTGRALTPLSRAEIFTPEFLAFLGAATQGRDSGEATRGARLERQARGVELPSRARS